MRRFGFLTLWVWLAFAAPVLPADPVPGSLAELAAGADLIFIGRCDSVSCHWNDDHSLILTANRFRVTRALKGTPGETFTVDELGGMVGSRGMTASGVPRFAVGDEVLLCVHRSPLGRWATFGAGRGKFRILRDARGRPWVRSTFYRAELAAMTPGGTPLGSAPLAVLAGRLLAASNVRREG